MTSPRTSWRERACQAEIRQAPWPTEHTPRGQWWLDGLYVGPSDGLGEVSFDVQVCSPEWLAARCAAHGFVDGCHTVVTTLDGVSEPGLRSFLTSCVENVSGATGQDVAETVARLGLWEFEDYRA